MTFPKFLGKPRQLQAKGDNGGAPGGEYSVQNFSMVCQEQTNWCWASVAQAIERHFGRASSQSSIATNHISRGQPAASCAVFDPEEVSDVGCGVSACQSHCNSPHSLGAILVENGRMELTNVKSTLSFSDLKSHISGGKPVPCRIAWPNGGGHFVCIAGLSDGGPGAQFVHVYDPLSRGVGGGQANRVTMRFEDFRSRYAERGGGAGLGRVSHFYSIGDE